MPIASSPKSYRPLLTTDFFTRSHRYSASVAAGKRPLVDVLNCPLTNYLEVSNIYVSRIQQPGEIIGTCKIASLIKENIIFVVLPIEADGVSRQEQYKTMSLAKNTKKVFLSVANFEITGQLEFRGKFDMKAILTIGSTTFLPLFQARATNANRPSVNFAGSVILANKASVDYFSIPGKFAGHLPTWDMPPAMVERAFRS